jgi:hypothetical protein
VLALQRLQQGGLLAADIGASTVVDLQQVRERGVNGEKQQTSLRQAETFAWELPSARAALIS